MVYEWTKLNGQGVITSGRCMQRDKTGCHSPFQLCSTKSVVVPGTEGGGYSGFQETEMIEGFFGD